MACAVRNVLRAWALVLSFLDDESGNTISVQLFVGTISVEISHLLLDRMSLGLGETATTTDAATSKSCRSAFR